MGIEERSLRLSLCGNSLEGWRSSGFEQAVQNLRIYSMLSSAEAIEEAIVSVTDVAWGSPSKPCKVKLGSSKMEQKLCAWHWGEPQPLGSLPDSPALAVRL